MRAAKTLIAGLTLAFMLPIGGGALAQGRAPAAAGAAQGGAAATRSTTQQRDRQADRTRDKTQDRDRDREHSATRLRDQDRVRDRDIYGSQLMSAEETERYRQQLRNAKTDQEWARLRAEHEEQMRSRATQRGVNLPAPVYGQHMLTAQETERYRRRLENARDEQARAQVRAEHEEMVRNRARELGMEAPTKP